MTNLRSLKRALISTVLSIALCVSMLVGTTYAWFTDTATSKGNTITTGTLDVDLFVHDENGRTELGADDAIAPDAPVFGTDILWEPNMTQVRYLSIKNNGTLALKYKVVIEVKVHNATNYDLTDVMYYQITPDATYDGAPVTAWDYNNENAVKAGLNGDAENVRLLPGAEHFFAISIHMDEEADNNYQDSTITFDIKVLAGQEAYESDDFSDKYDEFAGYPGTGFAPAMIDGQVAVEIPIRNEEHKVGSVLIPAGAVEDTSKGFEANITESDYKGNFTVASGMETVVFDVSVSNIKADNTVPLKTQLRIEAGKDPDTVKLYHVDTEIPCSYDPYTGYVTFETTSFSPFTVVYDDDSVYVPAPALPENIPTADVTYHPDWVGADIEWGNFGGVGPTPGKEAVIDAAFVFECPAEVDEAYRHWLCDFYVSLDCDLGENEIFLGGQYGTYLVGFHNGELTLEAGKELPLLGTALSGNTDGITNWTYEQIEDLVGTFICGVGNVGDSLNGATFTVCLRLINPENTSEYYDVNVVTYTFGGTYNIQ